MPLMPPFLAMRRVGLLALLLLLALGSVPTEAASSPACPTSPTCASVLKVEAPPPAEPLPADGSLIRVPVTVTYIANAVEPPEGPQAVGLSIRASPPWLVASVEPGTLYLDIPWPSTQQTVVQGTTALLLRAAADAPAFLPGTVQVEAHAPATDGRDAASTITELPVVVGFRAALTLVPQPAHLGLLGGEARLLQLDVRSVANADVRVGFEVVAKPHGLIVNLAESVVLERATPEHPAVKAVNLRIEAEPLFDAGDIVLRAAGAYALDPNVQGLPATTTVHVARGHDAEVAATTLGADTLPLAWPALAGAVLLVAAVAAWRRRQPR